MKKKVEETEISYIRNIFTKHRTDIDNVIRGINEASDYLKGHVDSSGLFEFSTRTMSSTDLIPKEESLLATQLFSELNVSLIGSDS